MSGVEILSSTEVVVEYATNWWLIGIIFLVVIAFGGFVGFAMSDKNKASGASGGCLIGALVGLLIWCIVGAATTTPSAYETQYKVTIDDSVSLTEFMDKYEIIDQEGKIYTVRERNYGET
jgi:Na+/proline symporter